ncbi:MAG: acetylornithine deacetylase [Methanomicrobiales archaeon HGW-Methanomicrobiales-4]|nr:MAG: acetylornithine deacetylase [Methanomicrobiales archaeon HGW-Methanomicrobiales-4]
MNSGTQDVVRICSDLVKIRSENPPGYTDEVIRYISDFCNTIGLDTVVKTRGRRHNLLSAKPQGRLLLCGHVDVVPALDEGWTFPPYSGLITEEFVHGRGSTDMKGGCAALLAALASVIESHGDPGVDIAFVADEEGKGEFGMEQLVGEGIISPCDAIIAEPSPSTCPIVGEKGVLRTRITFSGDAGHASLHPVTGNSAIMQACQFLGTCQTLHERVWPLDPVTEKAVGSTTRALKGLIEISAQEAERILSRVMYNPGMIQGGERVNVIAQRCILDMDMRIPWGCSIDEVIRILRDAHPQAIVDVVESADPSFSTPGWLSGIVCDGIHSVMQVQAEPGVSQAASDARYLRKHGAEVVVYGPGDLNLLHSVNENVPITMLRDCQQVYEYVLKNLNSMTRS